jgi:tetratricopeptide (TPR) repeat protein
MLWLEVGRYPAPPGEEEQRVTKAREMRGLVRANLPSSHDFQAACEGVLGQALLQRGRAEDREEAVQLLVNAYREIRDRRGPKFHRTTRALERLAGRTGIGTLTSDEQHRYLQHPAVRAALREGLEQAVEPTLLTSIASAIVQYPGLEAAHYDLALRAARRADELDPDNSAVLSSLGAAQYRAEHYEEAIGTFARADALTVEAGFGSLPANRAIIAMAHHRLGHSNQAEAALRHARELMGGLEASAHEGNQSFLREAERLIEDRATSPPPAEE